MKLEGKVALVTGAGSGFGKASAILFAKEGAKIITVDIDSKTGNQTVNLIKRDGGEASFVQADVSKSSDSERMIKFATDQYGRLDILFNNAGIPMAKTLVEDVEEALWDRIISVNLKSVFLASKIAIPLMKKQGGGVIINTSSAASVKVRLGYCAYATSKAAVNHLTKTLAIETAPFKIRVNSLSPVVAETPMMQGFYNEEMKKNFEATRQETLAGIPIGRFLEPQDVARAALYLASDDASMVTGINFVVDGGYTL
jgi:3-oxoacyl-[acyl-carrier protein] reductase